MKKMVVGRNLSDIFNNFGAYWREITNDDQTRWVTLIVFFLTYCEMDWNLILSGLMYIDFI
jgi:hypothetical protein